MVNENDFMTQLAGIGISGPQVSRIVDALHRTKADVSELIDPSTAPTPEQLRHAYRTTFAARVEGILLSENIILSNGDSFCWEVLSPTQIISATLRENLPLRHAMHELLRSHYGRLHPICSCDETFSRHPLHESGRKIWVASFTWAQWSISQRCLSSYWWTPIIVRSKYIKFIEGGASRLLTHILRIQLFNSEDPELNGPVACKADQT